jgi:hypothetical protein
VKYVGDFVAGTAVAGANVPGKIMGANVPGEMTGGIVTGEDTGASVTGKVTGATVTGELTGAIVTGVVTGAIVVVTGAIVAGATVGDIDLTGDWDEATEGSVVGKLVEPATVKRRWMLRQWTVAIYRNVSRYKQTKSKPYLDSI